MACGKTRAEAGEPWAVGTYIGAGSWLFGPGTCTYDAPPGVADLTRNPKGVAVMAKLVGEGTITESCNGRVTTHPVQKATALRIDGPTKVPLGARETSSFSVVPLAGTTELRGVHQGGTSPEWSLRPDCVGVAEFEGGAEGTGRTTRTDRAQRGRAEFAPVLGASDTGGPSIVRTLVPRKAGTCTIEASILGVATSRAVVIE